MSSNKATRTKAAPNIKRAAPSRRCIRSLADLDATSRRIWRTLATISRAAMPIPSMRTMYWRSTVAVILLPSWRKCELLDTTSRGTNLCARSARGVKRLIACWSAESCLLSYKFEGAMDEAS
jgi:hypothetical protein